MQRVVIGLGSGRCGTMSLAKILDSQVDTACTHEFGSVALPPSKRHKKKRTRQTFDPLPWDPRNELEMKKRLMRMQAQPHSLVGDCSLYLLPYVFFIAHATNASFVCLQRDREETIDSFLRWTEDRSPRRNHWQRHDGTEYEHTVWDKAFPDYPMRLSKREAVGMYYDDYYRKAETLQKRMPGRFRIFPTEALNDEKQLKELLQFAGAPNPKLPKSKVHWHVGPRKQHA